jgi:hypothetical protein
VTANCWSGDELGEGTARLQQTSRFRGRNPLLERRPSVACSGAGLATQKSSARTDNALGADVPLDPRKKRTVLQSRDGSHDSGPLMPFFNLSLLAALKFFCCNAESCVLNATAENS